MSSLLATCCSRRAGERPARRIVRHAMYSTLAPGRLDAPSAQEPVDCGGVSPPAPGRASCLCVILEFSGRQVAEPHHPLPRRTLCVHHSPLS